ncbi:choice-of-anchor U domain-containing protein [Limnobacter sp. MED105]|uniref:choice-of-anchor U domain-containing protein n=1 Tax=Limnobacter sp. MED105 TaxID=391597 RepID=UPI000156C604|nr:choice-of-anchor U domain-containing protein [Limnobacter sp. MED105]EDM85054.1 Agarase [Limnobacter sp. MED105]
MNIARLLSAVLLATLPLAAHTLPGPQLSSPTVISSVNPDELRIFTADIATSPDGRGILAWAEGGFVYLQRLNADGSANGMRINANAVGTGEVRGVDVVMDNDANFALTYTKGQQQDAVVYFRRFLADGSPEAIEYDDQSMQPYNLAGLQTCASQRKVATSNPAMDMDADGNVALVFDGATYCASTIERNQTIYRYLPKSASASAPLAVASVNVTDNIARTRLSAVDIQGSLVTIATTGLPSGRQQISLSRYNGTTQQSTVQVADFQSNVAGPPRFAVHRSASGTATVVWSASTFNAQTSSFSAPSVRMRSFDANNTPLTDTPVELISNSTLLGLSTEPDGDYAIYTRRQNLDLWSIFRFSDAGVAGETRQGTNVYNNGYWQTAPISISPTLSGNNYVVLYNRSDSDDSTLLHVLRYGGPQGTLKLDMQLSRNPIIAGAGDQIALRWISNAIGPFSNGTCQASGNWGGFVAPSGVRDLGLFTVAGDRTYSLLCGPAMEGLFQSVTLNVQNAEQELATPTINFTATPANLQGNATSTLSWSTTNATTCDATGEWSGSKAVNGSETVGPFATAGSRTYTLTCRNQGGPFATQSVDVTVASDTTPDTFSFTAVTGQTPSTNTASNTVTIAGLNSPAPISITGGTYSNNGSQFTSAAGTISNGQTLQLRTDSPAEPGETAVVTVTVGDFSTSFTVTTRMPDGASTAMVDDVDNNPVEFMSSEGTLNNLRTVATPMGAPTTREYPNGFFAFNLDNVTANSTVTVTITLPADARPTSYVKCNADGSSCAEFGGATFNNNVVVLTLTDNGAGDNDPREGFISDPGAPAVTPAAASGGSSVSSGGGGGGSLNAMLLPLVGLLLWRVRRKAS